MPAKEENEDEEQQQQQQYNIIYIYIHIYGRRELCKITAIAANNTRKKYDWNTF